jgi:hypothetical protein
MRYGAFFVIGLCLISELGSLWGPYLDVGKPQSTRILIWKTSLVSHFRGFYSSSQAPETLLCDDRKHHRAPK